MVERLKYLGVTQSSEYVKYAKIFSDYFFLIFIPTEDLGDPFLLILCFMYTNRQIIIYVSFQFLKIIFLLTFQKALSLFCCKIDSLVCSWHHCVCLV